MSKNQSVMSLCCMDKVSHYIERYELKKLMTINELFSDEQRSIKFNYVSYYKQEYIN